jgi:hypothetical protein
VEVFLVSAGVFLVSACLLSLSTSTLAILSAVEDDYADFILPPQSSAIKNWLSESKATSARYFTVTSFFVVEETSLN